MAATAMRYAIFCCSGQSTFSPPFADAGYDVTTSALKPRALYNMLPSERRRYSPSWRRLRAPFDYDATLLLQSSFAMLILLLFLRA